jgi:hypothetical protein
MTKEQENLAYAIELFAIAPDDLNEAQQRGIQEISDAIDLVRLKIADDAFGETLSFP